MKEGGTEEARLRLVREVELMRQRVTLGGLFYLAGWAVVSLFSPVYARHPVLGGTLAAAFLALAALRVLLRAPAAGQPALVQRAWIHRQWAVVLATAALWGGVLAWALLDPVLAPSRPSALLCSIAFATAYAHNFAMHRGRALLGILLIYLPAPLLLAQEPGSRAAAVTMAVYFLYVALLLLRSHREHQQRLDLEAALRHQRDLYEQLSRTDALTGLANRRDFSVALDRLGGEAQRAGAPLSLLMLDIDHFKRVNDEYGHEAGDACLVRFAERMQDHFGSPGACLARLGGEEFAVLLPGVPTADAATRAEAMRADLSARPLSLREGPMPVHVSIGVAGLDPGQARDAADLYRAADRALYRAKSEGRDRVRTDGA